MLLRSLALLLALASPIAFGYWEQVPGEASAIAIGPEGAVWTVGTDRESGGFGIYRWDGAQFRKAPGIAGVRIAVDARGNPWVVDSFNNVRRWSASAWQNLPGWGKDVATGADGSVWSVGLEGGLWQFRGQRFEKIYPGGFARVAVGPDGEPWAVDDKGQLVRRSASGWESVRSGTAAIAMGPNRAIWVLDTAQAANVFEPDVGWLRRGGPFREIAVGPDGVAWAVTQDFRIFRRMED